MLYLQKIFTVVMFGEVSTSLHRLVKKKHCYNSKLHMLRILQPEIAILAVPMEDIALNLLKKKKKAQISCTIDLRS